MALKKEMRYSALETDVTAITAEFHVDELQAAQMHADTVKHGASWEREIKQEGQMPYLVTMDSNGIDRIYWEK